MNTKTLIKFAKEVGKMALVLIAAQKGVEFYESKIQPRISAV